MRTLKINEAEASFHALLAVVEAGEEIALTRHGRVVARLLPGIGRSLGAPAHTRRGDSSAILEARFGMETGLISPLD